MRSKEISQMSAGFGNDLEKFQKFHRSMFFRSARNFGNFPAVLIQLEIAVYLYRVGVCKILIFKLMIRVNWWRNEREYSFSIPSLLIWKLARRSELEIPFVLLSYGSETWQLVLVSVSLLWSWAVISQSVLTWLCINNIVVSHVLDSFRCSCLTLLSTWIFARAFTELLVTALS